MSPDAVTVQLKALPAVTPLVGHVTVTSSAVPATFAIVDPVAVRALPSLAVLLMVNCPFDEQVTDIVPVVEVPLHAAGRLQVNV